MAGEAAADETTPPSDGPEPRLKIDEMLLQLAHRWKTDVFTMIPEVSSMALIVNWDFPQQEGLPTSIMMAPEGVPMHAGERAKALRNTVRFMESVLGQLNQELHGLEELGDNLGKRIVSQQAALSSSGGDGDDRGPANAATG
jgi:hypothetical protein